MLIIPSDYGEIFIKLFTGANWAFPEEQQYTTVEIPDEVKFYIVSVTKSIDTVLKKKFSLTEKYCFPNTIGICFIPIDYVYKNSTLLPDFKDSSRKYEKGCCRSVFLITLNPFLY